MRILIQRIITGKHELGPELAGEVAGVVANDRVDSLDEESPSVYRSLES